MTNLVAMHDRAREKQGLLPDHIQIDGAANAYATA